MNLSRPGRKPKTPETKASSIIDYKLNRRTLENSITKKARCSPRIVTPISTISKKRKTPETTNSTNSKKRRKITEPDTPSTTYSMD